MRKVKPNDVLSQQNITAATTTKTSINYPYFIINRNNRTLTWDFLTKSSCPYTLHIKILTSVLTFALTSSQRNRDYLSELIFKSHFFFHGSSAGIWECFSPPLLFFFSILSSYLRDSDKTRNERTFIYCFTSYSFPLLKWDVGFCVQYRLQK